MFYILFLYKKIESKPYWTNECACVCVSFATRISMEKFNYGSIRWRSQFQNYNEINRIASDGILWNGGICFFPVSLLADICFSLPFCRAVFSRKRRHLHWNARTIKSLVQFLREYSCFALLFLCMKIFSVALRHTQLTVTLLSNKKNFDNFLFFCLSSIGKLRNAVKTWNVRRR